MLDEDERELRAHLYIFPPPSLCSPTFLYYLLPFSPHILAHGITRLHIHLTHLRHLILPIREPIETRRKPVECKAKSHALCTLARCNMSLQERGGDEHDEEDAHECESEGEAR